MLRRYPPTPWVPRGQATAVAGGSRWRGRRQGESVAPCTPRGRATRAVYRRVRTRRRYRRASRALPALRARWWESRERQSAPARARADSRDLRPPGRVGWKRRGSLSCSPVVTEPPRRLSSRGMSAETCTSTPTPCIAIQQPIPASWTWRRSADHATRRTRVPNWLVHAWRPPFTRARASSHGC